MKQLSRPLFLLPLLVSAVVLVPRDGRAQQSCDVFDQCMQNGVCQVDGQCTGTPKPDNTTCNDGNDCTKDDSCQAGSCRGTPDVAKNGQPCDTGLGLCITGATCTVIDFPPASFAFCSGELVQCEETDENECTFNVCDPGDGTCKVFNNPCFGECASCDPASGACTANPKPNGSACDDFSQCTSNDQCTGGNCVGGGGTGPTATRTPTGAIATPTRTFTVAVSTPTRTSTTTSTTTRTSTRTPTRTATVPGPTRTNTATPTGSAACFGDCNGSGTLTASDIGRINSTILRCSPCAGGVPGGIASGCAGIAGGCTAADLNTDGCIRASELGRANQNILRFPPNGCPPPTP